MIGLFPSDAVVVIYVYDSKLKKRLYFLVEDILNVREMMIYGYECSNPGSGVLKCGSMGCTIDLKDGYFLTGVSVESQGRSRTTILSSAAATEAWRRVVEIFFRVKKRTKIEEPEKEEEGVIRVGKHRAFHPEIAKMLEQMDDSTGAVLISPGSPIDKALNEVYLSKRGKQGEG